MQEPTGHSPAPIADRRSAWRHPWTVALAMVAVVLLFYLEREHWNHLAGGWIYLLLLACPLLHLLMHGGHDSRGGHRPRNEDDPGRRPVQ